MAFFASLLDSSNDRTASPVLKSTNSWMHSWHSQGVHDHRHLWDAAVLTVPTQESIPSPRRTPSTSRRNRRNLGALNLPPFLQEHTRIRQATHKKHDRAIVSEPRLEQEMPLLQWTWNSHVASKHNARRTGRSNLEGNPSSLSPSARRFLEARRLVPLHFPAARVLA